MIRKRMVFASLMVGVVAIPATALSLGGYGTTPPDEPVAEFVTPIDGDTVGGDRTADWVEIGAYDPIVGTTNGDGISYVGLLYVDPETDRVIDFDWDEEAPYEFAPDLPDGSYVLEAYAYVHRSYDRGFAAITVTLDSEATPPPPAPETCRQRWTASYADGSVSQSEWQQLVINVCTAFYARDPAIIPLADAAWAEAFADGVVDDAEWEALRAAGYADLPAPPVPPTTVPPTTVPPTTVPPTTVPPTTTPPTTVPPTTTPPTTVPPTTTPPTTVPPTTVPPTTTPPNVTLDLELDRFYVNQAVPALDSAQAASERVAPVARRDGLARAFVSANEANSEQPTVELHWRRPSGATGVLTLSGPSSVPSNPAEGNLSSTFNERVGQTLLQPGLEIFVIVDPDNQIAEADETNNRWPASGWESARVADVPDLEVTWIPVIWNGTTGNINAGNIDQYEDRTMRMMPIPGIDSELHAPIVFNGNLASGQGWGELLDQVAALKRSEGSDRAYHAIVQRPPGQGIAGIAFRGYEAAVTFDFLPAASDVVAHEFGHNFGLPHAPCGGAAGQDPGFPYPDARIGTWGYDIVDGSTKDPASALRDVMSYCDPTWISDYNYRNVLDNRLEQSNRTLAFTGTALHVSGTVDAGEATLDPAYALDAGGLKSVAGEYTLVGTSWFGTTLFEVPFAAYAAEINGGDESEVEHFSFSVPLNEVTQWQLSTLTVERDGEVIGSRDANWAFFGGVGSAEYAENNDGTATVTWDGAAEVAVVRDVSTGEVLAVSETGSAEVPADQGAVEVVLSDGMGWTSTETVEP